MQFTEREKKEFIKDVFLYKKTLGEILSDYAAVLLKDDFWINTSEEYNDVTINVHQILDEEEYGGFIEEYFDISLTLACNGLNDYGVYSGVDTSHVYKGFDDKIGELVKDKLPEFEHNENINGIDFYKKCSTIREAVEYLRKLYLAFGGSKGLTVSKEEAKYN